MKKKVLALILCGLVLLGCLTGCGGTGNSSQGSSSESSTSSESSAADQSSSSEASAADAGNGKQIPMTTPAPRSLSNSLRQKPRTSKSMTGW